MILIHITPIAPNLPWNIEIIEFNENFESKEYFNAKIALPFGYLPNPNYALAIPENYVNSLKNEQFNYQTLGDKLTQLLSKHSKIIFSNQESYALFNNITNTLLIPDLLADKQIVSLKALVNIAISLRNVYPKHLKSLKALAQHLGILENTLGKSAFNILVHLNKTAPKIIQYFLLSKKTLPSNMVTTIGTSANQKQNNSNTTEDNKNLNSLPKDSFKFNLYADDNSFKIVLLIKKLANGFIALDLNLNPLKDLLLLDLCDDAKNINYNNIDPYSYVENNTQEFINNYIKEQITILNEPYLISPSSTISSEILEILNITPANITTILKSLYLTLNEQTFLDILSFADKLAQDHKNIILKIRPNLNNLNANYLEAVKYRNHPELLAANISTFDGNIRSFILDYIFRINQNQDSFIFDIYKEIISKRELNFKDDFINNLEFAFNKASNNDEKKRLEDLVSYLS